MNMVDTLVLTGKTETICLYSRIPFIHKLVMQIAIVWISLALRVNFFYNSTKLPCLEITSYQIKYSTVLWLLELLTANVPIFKEKSNYPDVGVLIGVYCRW